MDNSMNKQLNNKRALGVAWSSVFHDVFCDGGFGHHYTQTLILEHHRHPHLVDDDRGVIRAQLLKPCTRAYSP
jgi:hypothetical protein